MITRFLRMNFASAAVPALVIAMLASSPALSQSPPAAPQTATAAFTDSTAAGLGATKRVAIASVIVSFQASAASAASPKPKRSTTSR